MRTLFTAVLSMGVCIVMSFFAADKLCLGYRHFQLRAAKIEQESWLRARCAEPEFYANMRYHSTLCEDVEATARVGAAWYAINEVATSLPMPNLVDLLNKASWTTVACMGIVLLVCPSLLIAHLTAPAGRTIPLYVQEKGAPGAKGGFL
jgi:hypothetical protein